MPTTASRAPTHGLIPLGVALFFTQSGFFLYTAALPLYFASLGHDPTTIGLLIGVAAATELSAAFGVGPSIDRFGGRALLLLGASCYVAASLGYTALVAIPFLALCRLLQGLGIAAVNPAGYSYVPALVPARRQTVAFASLGAASNLAMAICPPLGLALLQGPGPRPLFLVGAACAAIGLGVSSRLPRPPVARRPFSLTFRREWLAPLGIGILNIIQWGVISTFLPLVAEPIGANPALLFAADAVAVLASRVPSGWLADRFGPSWQAMLGAALTIGSDVLLLFPIGDGTLVVSGALNGLGGGLILPPMLAQLSRRSSDHDRGTALSYFSVGFAFAYVLGSAGGGLLYPWLAFPGLVTAGAALAALGAVVAVADPLMRVPAHHSQPG